MARQTPFTEDDRSELTCIKSDYDYICEQFIQMKAQLQRMESHIQRQEKESAVQRRRGMPHVQKIFGDCWELKRELAALRRELDSLRRERNVQPATTQREKQEERHFSPTLEAPGRIQ